MIFSYAMKKTDVSEIYVSNYRELAVKRVFPELKMNELLMKNMPDYPEDGFPEKTYFYSIMNSLFRNGTGALIKTWRLKRSIAELEDKKEMVEVTSEILKR